jgi:acetylornithine deacetylase/succinyl-diaminopimelate desuccinylase-like protein
VPRTTAELLEELFDFIRIPSISSGDGDDADLRRAAEWVCERVRDGGGTAGIVETQKNPLAVGTISCGRAGAPRLLVYGHYDVQTVAPIESWDSPPFEPEVRDGYVYARGASDDKGNFHCLLSSLVDLARDGELDCDVTVVSDGEEEIGGDSVVRWLDGQDARYDAAVVFDSALVAEGWPLLTIGVRGVITGSLRVVTGVRDVHSGLYGGAALNAAHVLSTLIDGTRARDGLLPAALRADVREPSAEEVASWATLPSGESELAAGGIAPLDPAATADYYRRTFALPTFDVNAITCRDASQHRTIIPYEATAAISLRLVPDQTVENVWAALKAHLEGLAPAGATITLERWGASAGCAFDPALPPLVIARRVLAEVFGHECAVARTGGAIPLVSALHRHGVPTILSGVALVDDNIHAPNERLKLSNYEAGVRAARLLFRELATLKP